MTLALNYYSACPFCQMVLRVLPNIKAEVQLESADAGTFTQFEISGSTYEPSGQV